MVPRCSQVPPSRLFDRASYQGSHPVFSIVAPTSGGCASDHSPIAIEQKRSIRFRRWCCQSFYKKSATDESRHHQSSQLPPQSRTERYRIGLAWLVRRVWKSTKLDGRILPNLPFSLSLSPLCSSTTTTARDASSFSSFSIYLSMGVLGATVSDLSQCHRLDWILGD